MDRWDSSIEFIDLTEQDDWENARPNGHTQVNGTIASSAQIFRKSSTYLPSSRDVKPIFVDLTDSLEDNSGGEGKRLTADAKTARITGQNAAFSVTNHLESIKDDKDAVNADGVIQNQEEGGKQAQSERTSNISSNTLSGLGTASRRRSGELATKSASPSYVGDQVSSLHARQRPSESPVPLITTPGNQSAPIQKYQQFSPSSPSLQSIFQMPSAKRICSESRVPKTVPSPVESTSPKSGSRPSLPPSEKPVCQTSSRVTLTDTRVEKSGTPTHDLSAKRISSKENDRTTQSPHWNPQPNQAAGMAAVSTPDKITSPHQTLTLQTRSSLSQVVEDPSESPTSSSFPPDFDRGRFPWQRRRRGALNAPNPWKSQGHHTRVPLGPALSTEGTKSVINTRNGGIHRSSTLPKSRGAGFFRNLGSQSGHLQHAQNSERKASEIGGAQAKQRFQKESASTSAQLSCQPCRKYHQKCNRKKPVCGRCAALQCVCEYIETTENQNRFKPTEIPLNQEHLVINCPEAISVSQDINSSPTNDEGSDCMRVSSHQQNDETVQQLANDDSSSVPIKKEVIDRNELESTPDYLDASCRTRGWHHNGYADVKELFQKIALDAVQKRGKDFGDWPINLERTVQRVRAEALDLASKRFGFFVDRLAKSSGSEPNAKDVEWLQNKICKVFFDEASRAVNDDSSQESTPNSVNATEITMAVQPGLSKQLSNAGSNITEAEADCGGNLRRPSLTSIDAAFVHQTTSVSSLNISPVESFEKSYRTESVIRPSRAAAGTAASRITSQFSGDAETPEPEDNDPPSDHPSSNHRPVDNFERVLCPDCDCLISAHNFKVHVGTRKHQRNAHQRKLGRATQSEATEGARKINSRPTVSPIVSEQDSRRLNCSSRCSDHKISNTVTMKPQRRALRGDHLQSLAASLATMDPQVFRPYQGRRQGGIVDDNARQDLLSKEFLLRHVDLIPEEWAKMTDMPRNFKDGVTSTRESSASLAGRDEHAIRSQLQSLDDIRRQASSTPVFALVESHVMDPNARTARHLGSLLRHRELGSSSHGRYVENQGELKTLLSEDIKLWRSFKGASHDVVAVAWAPNSMNFAAGAVAHSNFEDLQYNRPCNLMFGDLRLNTLTELPDHHIDRQKAENGPNSSQDMLNACDPKVYKTVTSIKFHPKGHQIYTASEDQTVKIWNLSTSKPECIRTLRHSASVTGLDVSPAHLGMLATASQDINNAVRVFGNSGAEKVFVFSSTRALMKPEWKIYPESLLWGPSASSSNFLLTGFNAYGGDKENSTEGHLCLWDAHTGQDLKPTPSSQAIHTATWHPTLPYFATGGAPGLERTDRRTTKTVVRAWDFRHVKRLVVEYECHSHEMTDVTFHPLDQNIVTAGCTDSVSYVWDWRWPEQPLHQLRHGKSIMPNGERDTGVMMSLWGTGNSLYYTGSSDGQIRAWDIRRHPSDVLIRTVAQLDAGIQSGAFSPDGSHLLVGDATGGIHVLSSAPWEPSPILLRDDEIRTSGTSMNVTRAPYGGEDTLRQDYENPGTAGIEAAREFLSSGEIALDPVYGPGKGPNYRGPYSMHDREPSTASILGRLKKPVYRKQPFSRWGEIRPERAEPIRTLAAARKEVLDKSGKNIADNDDADYAGAIPKAPGKPRRQGYKGNESCHSTRHAIANHSSPAMTDGDDHDIIAESEMVEENNWWPQLGEEEIKQARVRPSLRKG